MASLWNLLMLGVAFAQEATPTAGAKPSMLENLLPFLVLPLIIYFLMIRPQSKQAKLRAATMAALKRGDSVLTNGGILGTIEGLTDKFVTLEVANGVRIRILRSQIAGPMAEEAKS